MSTTTWLVHLGLIPYDAAVDCQMAALHARAEGRTPDVLFLLEHPPVITRGRSAKPAHLVAAPAELERRGIALRESSRGGDVTLHAPGQLVGYPILDLNERGRDVHRYLRDLEQALIGALAEWGIAAGRVAGATGVWVGDDKVAAIGVGVKRWVTCHGFALNANTDLSLFDTIVPCGLHGKGVTSIARLLGRPVAMEEVASRITAAWRAVFTTRLTAVPFQEWERAAGVSSSSGTTLSRNTRTSAGSHCEPAPSARTWAACREDMAER